jgi:hypothetical protein
MSFNGSGTFQINSAGQPVVAGTVITAAAFNALTADLATGLSTCITKDGQTSATANIPMGNNKFTGLSAGTAATDSTNLGQVQGNVASLISVAGIDTITGLMSPTLTAYATGAMYWFVAAGTNTGAVTLNIDGLGAKSVTRDGSTALIAGDIVNGQVAVVVYDGTRFQLQKANAFGTLTATTINTTNLTATGTVNLTGATVSNGGSVTTIDINGGTVDGVTIGGASAGAGTFTNLTASGTINFTGATVSNGGSVTTVDINGGTIDGAIIGGASAAAGTFTTATVGAGLVGTPSLTTTGDTNTGLYFPAADTIAVANGGTERMRVTSSGNVGIGTSSPDYLLTIQSAGDAQLSLKNSSGTTKAYIGTAGIFGGVSTDDLRIRSEATNIVFGFSGAEKMRITSNGDVGIGTSSPTASVPLTILANSGNAIAQNIRGEATGIGVLLFSDNSDVENGRLDFRTNYAEIKQARNAPLVFSTNATERMRITSSGNVQIGTAALATTATDGFLYVPTCAGTPTGTPTAITGLAPIVVNTTNNKLYFYSGGAWRDAGP